MNKSTEDHEEQEDPTPEEKQVTEKPPQQAKGEEITPERYQGLQRVLAKRDKELQDLKEQLAQLSEQLAEKDSSLNLTSKDKEGLQSQLQQMQEQLNSATSERDKMNAQLSRQKILLEEFPQLATLSKYIPAGETEEDFKASAMEFQEAFNKAVERAAGQKLEGSVPPMPKGSKGETPSDTNEEDRLWSAVYQTAGIPGKEKAYAEADRALQTYLKSKTT